MDPTLGRIIKQELASAAIVETYKGLDLGVAYAKEPVKSIFNRPKIISCQKLTFRVRVGVIATSERSNTLK